MRGGGQAGTEFIILLAAAFVIVIIFLAFSSSSLLGLGAQQSREQAQSSVDALASAADSVYSQGIGASQTVTVTLPGNTNFDPNYTYIGRPSRAPAASANSININLNGTDVFASTNAPLTGSFPHIPGTYQVRVVSQGAYVSIGTHLLEASPQSINIGVDQNGRKTATLSFKVAPGSAANSTVRASIYLPWNYSGVSLNASPSFFSAYGYTDVPVTISVAAQPGAGGVYNSQLIVNATSAASDETFAIPIIVEVS